MNNNPLVSVMMNCYNSGKYLKEAIQSVVDQTYPDWEIIFWDNQSTDKSAEIAKSFKDGRIKYYYAREHTGLGAARNLAFEKCTGDYIAFLDCDDVWLPSKLEKQVRLFKERPDVDFIYTNFYVLDMEGKKSDLAAKTTQPEGDIFGPQLLDYSVGILTVMMTREAIAKLDSLFDPSLTLTEDYEFFMRILYSFKAAYIPDPLASYRVHPDMSSYVNRTRWIEEYRYVNRRFRTLDKENRYSKEINCRENQITLTEASLNMVQGNLREARSAIAPHKFEKIIYLFMYMATFLPVSVWFFLRPLWRRGVWIR